jgi:hypothetical protein
LLHAGAHAVRDTVGDHFGPAVSYLDEGLLVQAVKELDEQEGAPAGPLCHVEEQKSRFCCENVSGYLGDGGLVEGTEVDLFRAGSHESVDRVAYLDRGRTGPCGEDPADRDRGQPVR